MAVSTSPTATYDFAIDGMTCASCVRRVEQALEKVDGVSEVTVNLATERARVVADPASATPDTLAAAVERAGYQAGAIAPDIEMPEPPGSLPQPGEATFDIGGMTCASCVRRVETALEKSPGVRNASVNLATERATVSFDPDVTSM